MLDPIPMDPHKDFGEPVMRPRLYFLLIRKDVSVVSTPAAFCDALCREVRADLRRAAEVPLSARLLPMTHALVKRALREGPRELAAQRGPATAACPRPRHPPRASRRAKRRLATAACPRPEPRWVSRHAQFRRDHGLPPFADVGGSSRQTVRERDMWDLFSALHKKARTLVVDLSQSVLRGSTCRVDGLVPTLTPASKVLVRLRDGTEESQRLLLPEEKLLLQGIPIHRLKLPPLSGRAISALAGNTMHTHCVGMALLLAISLLQWPGDPEPESCRGEPSSSSSERLHAPPAERPCRPAKRPAGARKAPPPSIEDLFGGS